MLSTDRDCSTTYPEKNSMEDWAPFRGMRARPKAVAARRVRKVFPRAAAYSSEDAVCFPEPPLEDSVEDSGRVLWRMLLGVSGEVKPPPRSVERTLGRSVNDFFEYVCVKGEGSVEDENAPFAEGVINEGLKVSRADTTTVDSISVCIIKDFMIGLR